MFENYLKRITPLMALLLLVFSTSSWAGQFTFTDDSGRNITIDRSFTRIISLYGAHTENLFALGLDTEIIGVADTDDYPNAVLTKPRFSHRDDPEKFIAAKADLVLIRPMIFNGYQRLVTRLQDAGLTVVSLQPNNIEEMYNYWLILGRLTDREEQARGLVSAFKNKLTDINQRLAAKPASARPRVFFEAIHGKIKTFAPGSMPIFALEAAGGRNVAGDAVPVRGTNIAAYGHEHLLSRAGEIDVYLAQTGPMNTVQVQTIKDESGFTAIKAVRDGRIYLVDEKIVSRPTLRLGEGIEILSKFLYPENQ
ncbi:MAG: ABC transporter substrate-binding protein [Deltaproteobacteria bacterium]|nr:ABC transporter substrate-binding protein [Deltaproteobacteria bacterium]